MIMIALGVIWVLLILWAAFENDDFTIAVVGILFGGAIWFVLNAIAGTVWDESRLVYTAPLEKIEGTEYYMIDVSPPVLSYEVDRESGRRIDTADINFDIHYSEENKIEIYESDALWWLAVEMDLNYTTFIVTLEDEDLILTP